MHVRALILSLLLAATPLAAQEPDTKSQDAKDTSDATASEPPAQPSQAPAAPASKPPRESAATPQRFEPSEKVRADFDVSFPVDI